MTNEQKQKKLIELQKVLSQIEEIKAPTFEDIECQYIAHDVSLVQKGLFSLISHINEVLVEVKNA